MALLAAVVFGLSLSACTFERRGDVDEGEDPSAEQVQDAQVPTGDEDPLVTVRRFRESVATGDLSLALALLDRDASLIDAIIGQASEVVTRGELLLELRRRHAAGIQLEAVSSTTTTLAEDLALVVSQLAVLQVREDGIGQEVGRLHETVLLRRMPEGWRIYNLHRSIADHPMEIPALESPG